MDMITSRAAIGIAAGVCGTLILGYCIYFDKVRHSDPDFKKKLRERRRAKQKESQSRAGGTVLPDMKDHEAVQKFFLQEVQLGEEMLASGQYDQGVEHLANAVAVCGQADQLLQVLQQTLPPQVFHLLMNRLPNMPKKRSQSGTIQDDDVE